MLTLTPSSEVGNTPPTIELLQLSVTGDRFVPRIVTQEFVTPPCWKLAPFSTLVITGNGGGDCCDGATTRSQITAAFVQTTWVTEPHPSNWTVVHVVPPSIVFEISLGSERTTA